MRNVWDVQFQGRYCKYWHSIPNLNPNTNPNPTLALTQTPNTNHNPNPK